MAQDATKVRVALTGVVYNAPLGTAMEEDAVTVPPVGFTDLGHISADGVTESNGSSSQTIKNWGGATVRVLRTEKKVTYSFTAIETNAAVLAAFYDDADATTVLTQITNSQGTKMAWVIDAVDGSDLIRMEIPIGMVVETGDVTYATENEIGYPITIECFDDSAGVKVYKRMAA